MEGRGYGGIAVGESWERREEISQSVSQFSNLPLLFWFLRKGQQAAHGYIRQRKNGKGKAQRCVYHRSIDERRKERKKQKKRKKKQKAKTSRKRDNDNTPCRRTPPPSLFMHFLSAFSCTPPAYTITNSFIQFNQSINQSINQETSPPPPLPSLPLPPGGGCCCLSASLMTRGPSPSFISASNASGVATEGSSSLTSDGGTAASPRRWSVASAKSWAQQQVCVCVFGVFAARVWCF